MSFSWTFDQFQRYAVLRAFAEEFGRREGSEAAERLRVLDVGGVSPDRVGRTVWLPAREILSSETGGRKLGAEVFVLDRIVIDEPGFVQGRGERLPFRDGGFDIVAAMDVLEHIPPAKRGDFIAELCRVSGEFVLLCAPVRSEAVEKAEAVIAAAVRDQYGIEHQQLREHRDNGLPRAEEVEASLAAEQMSAGVSFSLGSLANWLFGQSFRSALLGRRDSARFLEAFDAYMISSFSKAEFELPAYRRFWIYSKRAGQAKLESCLAGLPGRMDEMSRRLTEGIAPASFPGMLETIAEFRGQEMVSAVVVSSGNTVRLHSCLQHLLAQKVDFDLEVSVWHVGGGVSLEGWLKERFPGVRVLRANKTGGRAEEGGGNEGGAEGTEADVRTEEDDLFEILQKLRGGDILLLAENVDLDAEAVARLYRGLLVRAKAEDGVVVVRHRRRRFFTMTRFGGRSSIWKFAAGRVPTLVLGKKAGWDVFLPQSSGRWAYGECLFFRRRAVFARRHSPGRPGKKSVFLWEFV